MISIFTLFLILLIDMKSLGLGSLNEHLKGAVRVGLVYENEAVASLLVTIKKIHVNGTCIHKYNIYTYI
jgi:hypothetical protein